MNLEPLAYKADVYKGSQIYNLYIPTLTVVFRNVLGELPKGLMPYLIDASLFLFLSQYGWFNYMDFVGSVYRKHNDGLWTGSNNIDNYSRSLLVRIKCWKYLPLINRKALSLVIIKWAENLYKLQIENRRYFSALKTLLIMLFHIIYSGNFRIVKRMSIVVFGWFNNQYKKT